ncbi:hemagglutinin repeat-containing protein [Neisseria yangbaofengii]|uniref:hemagglutinin repeat-containing protein n=1 Tax=Neisseria yangbaofengii TaxID=2709396 RepID=UPI0013EA6678|nr:hemagglutinin repeat-containing protein [Neisseria yangbaofengii]
MGHGPTYACFSRFIGNKTDLTHENSATVTGVGSVVGSGSGHTGITAGRNYTQRGSNLSADGNIDVTAHNIRIDASEGGYHADYYRRFTQKGMTVGISSPVTQAVEAVQTASQSLDQTGQSRNSRTNAMAAANTGWQAYQAAQSVGKAINSEGAGINVNITYGEQRNESKSHILGTQSGGSAVQAGGHVKLTATGNGSASNITVRGSDVAGKGGTFLTADNKIDLLAAGQTHSERSNNSQRGWNAGVALDFSNGVSVGFTGGGNYGKGYGNGDDVTHRHSHIGDKDSRTVIQSGGDVNIKGAQVKGKGIALAAENLRIESVQDTAVYHGKQQNISGQVTVGYGFSGSGDYSQSKVNADHRSVTEQSGLYAGDDGFDIKVKNHTDLKGGIITSTEKAESEGKNRFQTASISHSDMENHSRYEGESFGLGTSAEISGKTLGQSQPDHNSRLKNVSDKDTFSKTIGYGSDKDSQSSVTKSGIGTRNIIIGNDPTGEATEAVYTATRTETAEQNSGRLKNTFDKERVLKELNIQVQVTKEFRQNAFATINAYVLPKQEALREKIKNTQSEEEKTVLYNQIYKLQYLKRILETTVGVVSGTPDTAITQGTLQLAATKLRQETLENSRLFKGIYDSETKLTNAGYDSGYFDGVKLGGVRIDLDAICGGINEKSRCKPNPDGSYKYIGGTSIDGNPIPTLKDAIDKNLNSAAKGMHGLTGGFQPIQGEMFGQYVVGSWKDWVVESFAGTHDVLGGQMWGLYDEVGNTTRGRGEPNHPNKNDGRVSSVTAIVAIPAAAPFALSDLMSPDV